VAITDPMVLPADLLLVPVEDLADSVRRQIVAEDGGYALTRPNSRTPSRIIDAQAAELLKEFRDPATIVQAVVRYSREKNIDPEQTLEEAYPMLERLARERLLVPADSEEARKIQPSLEAGASFAGVEVVRCVQALEDTELYQVKTTDGQTGALKMLRPEARAELARMFDREAAILERLDGNVSPKLLQSGTEEGRPYLLCEWCSGAQCSSTAAELRRPGVVEGTRRLLGLCGAILDAYAQLHERSVIHSDIHPGNLLVDDGRVKIIDFGLARVAGVENEFRRARRGGIGYFFEPEYAKAAVAGKAPPHSSALGEQYALGALIYFLMIGKHYLDFSAEKKEMFRQIVDEPPLAFAKHGVEAWPELEKVLATALSKNPLGAISLGGSFCGEAESCCCAGSDESPGLPYHDGAGRLLGCKAHAAQHADTAESGRPIVCVGLEFGAQSFGHIRFGRHRLRTLPNSLRAGGRSAACARGSLGDASGAGHRTGGCILQQGHRHHAGGCRTRFTVSHGQRGPSCSGPDCPGDGRHLFPADRSGQIYGRGHGGPQ